MNFVLATLASSKAWDFISQIHLCVYPINIFVHRTSAVQMKCCTVQFISPNSNNPHPPLSFCSSLSLSLPITPTSLQRQCSGKYVCRGRAGPHMARAHSESLLSHLLCHVTLRALPHILPLRPCQSITTREQWRILTMTKQTAQRKKKPRQRRTYQK